MKKVNSLGMTIIFLTLSAIFYSCSKGGGITPTPPPNPPPGGTKLAINAGTSPSSVFASQTVNINWSANKTATVNGVTGTSGTYAVTAGEPEPDANKSVAVTVTGTAGDESASSQANYLIFSKFLENMCWNYTTSNYGKWTCTRAEISLNGGASWDSAAKDNVKWVYYPDSTRKAIFADGQTGTGHYQITHVGGDTYINLGETYNPPNLFKVLTMNATTMVLLQTQATAIFRITYTKGG